MQCHVPFTYGIKSLPTPMPSRTINSIKVDPNIIARALTQQILNLSIVFVFSIKKSIEGKLIRGSASPRNACRTIQSCTIAYEYQFAQKSDTKDKKNTVIR